MEDVFRKLLKDYPTGKPFEAADGCESCGARFMVEVIDVDEDGLFGMVEWSITHKPDCPENPAYDEEEEGLDWDVEGAGWELSDEPVTIALPSGGRKMYYPIVVRSNITPCLECGRLIVGTPIIVLIKEMGSELDFCPECAERLGIISATNHG
jgi:hypothetical protein